MEKAKILRINQLYSLSKTRDLTDDEKSEQSALRNEYLAEIRAGFRSTLENTAILYPDGTKEKLKRR